jgi:hypothetical protein
MTGNMNNDESNGPSQGASTGKHRRALLFGALVFTTALSIRLGYLGGINESPFYDIRYLKGTDAYNFFVWALKIANGEDIGEGVYTIQAPLYPYFLALIFKLTGGGNLLVPRFVQLVLGSFTALFAFSLGRRLKGESAGLTAGLMTAFYGPMILYEGTFLRDGMIAFLYTAFVYTLIRARERPGLLSGSLSGALFGLSILIKPNILMMVPVIGWCIWNSQGTTTGLEAAVAEAGEHKRRVRKSQIKLTLSMACALAAVMAPMTFKNLKAGDSSLFLSRTSSFTFINSNHPTTTPSGFDVIEIPFPNRINDRVRELDRETGGSGFRALAAIYDLYRERPLDFMKRELTKVWTFIYGYEVPENMNYYVEKRYVRFMRGPWITWPILLPLAVIGMWAMRVRWRHSFELYSYVALLSAGTIAFFVVGRYRAPLVPVLAAFSGAGAAWIIEMIKKSRWKAAAAIAVAVIIAGVSWPRVADPLRWNDYRNLVRYHAMKNEMESARRWAQEGREKAERILLETGSANARYRLAQIKYLAGDPVSEVEAELWRAREKEPQEWLLLLIESLEQQCRLRRELGDPTPGGFRF